LALLSQEAALYIQEGEDDAKFYQHPQNKHSKRAYDTLHHYTYRIGHLIISVLLLMLALMEFPTVGQEKITPEEQKILIRVRYKAYTSCFDYLYMHAAWICCRK
jgi:hypothetical protein